MNIEKCYLCVYMLFLTKVLSSKLRELDSIIHCLLNLEEQLSSSDGPSGVVDDTVTAFSMLVTRLAQTVWPALAVIGGLDSGFCLGRLCIIEGPGGREEAIIVSIPDAEQNMEVEKRLTDCDVEKLKTYKLIVH